MKSSSQPSAVLRQHAEKQPRHAGHEQRYAPAQRLGDAAADDVTQPQSQRQAQHEDGEGPGSLLGREQIAQKGIGRRRTAGPGA